MTIKIWHQSSLNLSSYPRYRAFLEGHYASVFADSDVEVHLHGVSDDFWGGSTPSDVATSPFSYLEALGQFMIDQALCAERDGFDAFMIGSYTEPYLREVRSAVTIPVTSILESSVLMACTVADQVGMVTLNDWNVWCQRAALEKHQLQTRIAGYWVAQDLDESALEAMFEDPSDFAEVFTAAARNAIGQFADAIVPSEGVVAALVAAAGLHEVDGVSVVDGIAAPLIHTAMLAKAHRRLHLESGRHWAYTKPHSQFDSVSSRV